MCMAVTAAFYHRCRRHTFVAAPALWRRPLVVPQYARALEPCGTRQPPSCRDRLLLGARRPRVLKSIVRRADDCSGVAPLRWRHSPGERRPNWIRSFVEAGCRSDLEGSTRGLYAHGCPEVSPSPGRLCCVTGCSANLI